MLSDARLRALEQAAETIQARVSDMGVDGAEEGLIRSLPEVLAELRALRNPLLAGLCERLGPWANQIAARFGRPVYLVGSALRLPDPRDVDVRVVLTDEEFAARYGDAMEWLRANWSPSKHDGSLRYAMDIGDLSREATLILKLNLDFQVQPPAEARRHMADERGFLDIEGRRRRIDTVEGLEPVVLL